MFEVNFQSQKKKKETINMHISDCELRSNENQEGTIIFSSFIILFLKNSKSSQKFEKKKKPETSMLSKVPSQFCK